MRILLKLLFSAFMFFVSFLAISSETVLIVKKLQWNDDFKGQGSEGGTFDFYNSTRDERYFGLPYMIHRQKLNQSGEVVQINWRNIETSVLPKGSVTDKQFDGLNNDWQVYAEINDGGGIPYLVVLVLPLRLDASRSIERLLSYDIELTIESRPVFNHRSLNFTNTSVLSEGTWYKIATARDGIYKVDKSILTQLGINASALNPQQINIYGNGGSLLPEANSDFRYDDLQKCSIFYSGNNSSTSFADSDYFLFYAKGPDSWQLIDDTALGISKWNHTKHYYSDSAYYFIRIDDTDPKRIQTIQSSSLPATHTVDKFQDFQYLENDTYNLGHSGREFYGDFYDLNTTGQYTFNFPNVSTTEAASLEADVAIRSVGGNSTFTFSAGGQSNQTPPVITFTGTTASPATVVKSKLLFTPSSPAVNVNVQLNKYSNTAEVKGYVDYLRINVTRMLTLAGNQMKFRDTTNISIGNVGQFQLGGILPTTKIWDITDVTTPKEVSVSIDGSSANWKYSTEILNEFIAFNNTGFLTPMPIGAIANQNLHAAENIDLVIIAAPKLMDAAQQLADIHTAEGLTVLLTNTVAVFNEFSSGNPDVIAPRMLMKMLYDRANGDTEKMPQNLVLFGDGDYSKNKGVSAFTGNNVIVFETNESLSPTASSVSDDYYVYLSDNDNGATTNSLDAGVGRICASNISEALSYVNKIRAYISENTSNGAASCTVCEEDDVQSPYGNWRNNLVFVADDQDGGDLPNEYYHLAHSDEFADTLQSRNPEYDIIKIYMDAYKQETTPGGERYPEAEEAIRNRVQNGALLVTYLGHGGERGWAHERVLDINTIKSWTNLYRMPVFLTATCELARYDDPGFKSAGELLVLNPKGGAIAMLTTTRVVFVGSNKEIDEAFFEVALRETEIAELTLGKINQLTKNGVGGSNASRANFSLLGDPALKMAYPRYNVVNSHINGIEVTQFTDTLKALQQVEMKGYLTDQNGNVLSGFNGYVYPTVYDKMTKVETQNNDGGIVQEFNTFNRVIFKGRATVTNGQFSFQFVVPYDINYSVGKGRVSFYALSGNDDGHGYNQGFDIGSSLSGVQLNKVGPEIDLFLNDSTFVSGGITDTRPYLLARLRDENGINTVGNGIGHDLTLTIDGDMQNPLVLNDYYESDLDTYKSGKVKYQLLSLPIGSHSLTLKVWDVHNNSSIATLDFVVTEEADLALKHVLNYPNPFTTNTSFMFEHNQSCETLDVRIQVFTVSGKLVKTITQTARQNGFRTEPIAWDGRDDFGDIIGKGVYVYKVEIRNTEGQKAEQFEKLVILK